VLVSGGGATMAYLLVGPEAMTRTSQPSTTPTAVHRGVAPGTGVQGQTVTPVPESPMDARFVTVGQCGRNEGGGGNPKLAITSCGPNTYEVLGASAA
jgi:hypothetical protein